MVCYSHNIYRYNAQILASLPMVVYNYREPLYSRLSWLSNCVLEQCCTVQIRVQTIATIIIL